jgi:glycosyltransferase involved in cell wall biosynthesis
MQRQPGAACPRATEAVIVTNNLDPNHEFDMFRRVAIYHGMLWAKYKGLVFSQVHARSSTNNIVASFVQVAETDTERSLLTGIDLSYHQYPFRLLFRGSYESVGLLRLSLALAKDLIRNPCDLVVLPGYDHGEYWAMLIVCIFLRRRRAVFCDSTIYDREKHTWKEIAKRTFFRRCDGFFCYGVRSKEYILRYGVDEKRVHYRVQAAALPAGYDPLDVLRHYQATSFDANAPKFLYVGRLSIEKGLNDLLDAFNLVHATMPRASLELVGAGPLKEELITRTRELGLVNAVTFSGSKNLEEIARLLLRSAALVLPSHSEPWGLVVNESLSYGCPVVVSNVCGCVPELVIDGVTGYSFEVRDIQGLSRSMLSAALLLVDRAAVAKSCLDAISGFNPERAATQILEGCNRILAMT